ncbi:hypothetical protein L1987_08413 [Smallanthus sonchifolius]|uniref:Uncharacterized protein n=1 Tax=Smallanthus sonchifolius TaxID=185202 RepID=A0ACB9JMH4_9ASTR|nr:hypothetical protein L1987_08413 [Smallanthus sonchifolius]
MKSFSLQIEDYRLKDEEFLLLLLSLCSLSLQLNLMEVSLQKRIAAVFFAVLLHQSASGHCSSRWMKLKLISETRT